MKRSLLLTILRIARLSGLFALARLLTADDLRILCYHGAALRDEHHFRPGLFMSKETFAARMAHLARQGYPVISLDDAVAALPTGRWPKGATVITIDDGWFGTYSLMAPVLRAHGFPAILYITSYYLEKQTQVFNVAASYLLWRARGRWLDLARVAEGMSGCYDLSDEVQRVAAWRHLDEHAEALDGAEPRQALLRQLCDVLEIDAAAIEGERICAFLTLEEARELQSRGVDIGLHSHRHRFPSRSFEAAQAEIEENRRALAVLINASLHHFCYPSGEYEQHQLAWLKPFGIASATTTKRGFTRVGDSRYELRRFLDSEQVSPLEFEAEMSGFFELLRRCGYAI